MGQKVGDIFRLQRQKLRSKNTIFYPLWTEIMEVLALHVVFMDGS